MTAPVSLTYVGVQLMTDIGVMLLVNDLTGSTKCLVAYFDEEPVRITEKEGECS